MSDREQVDLTEGVDLLPPDVAPAADAMADDVMDEDLLGGETIADAPSDDGWLDPMEESADVCAEAGAPAHRSGVPAKQPLPEPAHKGKSSPTFLGLLQFATTLFAGLALGYGALTVAGGSPQQLLNFDGLMRLERILAFGQYPTNLFWITAVGVVLIACLTGAAVARAIGSANERTDRAEHLFEIITALDLEDEQGWRSAELDADPRAAAFAANTLGAYRLLQAKMTRYVGQEGELHRLEKALVEGTRVDLADGYENPAVGSLADEILRVFDDWVAAVQANEQSIKKAGAAGSELVGLVGDACAWNATTLERITAHGASLERLGVKIGKLIEMDGEEIADPEDDVHAELVAGLEDDVESLAEALESIPDADAAAEIVGIVDQASKLTFKVAMETARLGEHGQKLLPMTQDLEELITAARDLAGGRGRKTGVGGKFGRLCKRMRKRVAALGASAGAGSEASEANDALGREIGSLTQQIADGVRSVARKFPLQTDRLVQLGKGCSELTGAEFDPEAFEAGHPKGGGAGMAVEAFDPFGRGADTVDPEQAGLVSDPFASTPSSTFGDASPADEPGGAERYSSTGMAPALQGFSLDAEPEPPQVETSAPVSSDDASIDPAPLATLDPSALDTDAVDTTAGQAAEPLPPETPPAGSPRFEATAEADDPQPQADVPVAMPGEIALPNIAEPAADDGTPADGDRVYDLADLGAVALHGGADPAPAREDRIYELSELGAVAVE